MNAQILPLDRLKGALSRGLAARRPVLRAALALLLMWLALFAVFAGLGLLSGSAAAFLAAAVLAAAGGALLVRWLMLAPLEREYESAFGLQASSQRALAQTDSVTGALSRRAITSSLLEAMAVSERYRHPLSVVLARIDRFGALKTALGRRGTVRLLQAVAGQLDEAVRLPDRVGRYGEDEFLIVLPHTALKDAERIMDRIRAGTAALDLGRDAPRVGLGIEVTRYRRGDDLEQIISRLSRALPAEAPGRAKPPG